MGRWCVRIKQLVVRNHQKETMTALIVLVCCNTIGSDSVFNSSNHNLVAGSIACSMDG